MLKLNLNTVVHGREITLPEDKLLAILEQFYPNEDIEYGKKCKPNENSWFFVNPTKINRELFSKERANNKQEKVRQLITLAFERMEEEPEKYGRKFLTFIPRKTWEQKTIDELFALSCKLGDHNADIFEQALEWAQQIQNGQSWEEVCNKPDEAKWYRLVKLTSVKATFIGGATGNNDIGSVSNINMNNYFGNTITSSVVPKVVEYCTW